MTVARFRPPLPSSKSVDGHHIDLDSGLLSACHPALGNFGAVLPPSADNQALFRCVGIPLVDALIDGKNGSVLCYGQTGSGKTHSIVGNGDKDEGLLPRCVRYLFERCEANRHSMRYRVSVSVCEIYKEEVRDLMTDISSSSSSNKKKTARCQTAHVQGRNSSLCGANRSIFRRLVSKR